MKTLSIIFIFIANVSLAQYYTWNTPVLITDTSSNNSNCDAMSIYTDGDDDTFVFWEKSNDTLSTEIWMKKNIWDTASFQVLAQEGVHFTNPVIFSWNYYDPAGNDTILDLIYQSNENGNEDIFKIRYCIDGNFSDPYPIANTEADEINPAVGSFGEIVWQSEGKIYFIQEDGSAYTNPVVVDSGNCFNPCIHGDPVYVIYQKTVNDTVNNLYRFYEFNEWSDVIEIDTDGENPAFKISEMYISPEFTNIFWQHKSDSVWEIHGFDLNQWGDTTIRTITSMPDTSKTSPSAGLIPILVDQSRFYMFVLGMVVHTPDYPTEIYANNYPVYYENSPPFFNVSNDPYPNDNPQIIWGNPGYWTIDAIMNYEATINGNSAIYATKNTVEIVGSIDENENENPLKLTCFPNPFSSQVSISYTLENNSHISIDILSNTGEVICNISKGFQQQGEHKIMWDGRNNSGSFVNEGVYLCRIIADGKQTAIPIVYINL